MNRIVPNARSAFTLLELLVVVAVIALLAAIVLGVGPKVIGGQQKAVTTSALRALDSVLDEYMEMQGGAIPPYEPSDYAGAPGTDLAQPGDELLKEITSAPDRAFSQFPDNDAPRQARFPDASVFIRAARGCCDAADKIIAGLPQSVVRATLMPEDTQATADEQDTSPSLLDAWAMRGDWEAPFVMFDVKPILFVHPSNQIAQALYGRCLNNRPYFMSAGPDRLYGTTNEFNDDASLGTAAQRERALKALEDNIYSYTPGPVDRQTTRR